MESIRLINSIVRLMDMRGQLIAQWRISEIKVPLDLSGLAEGVYQLIMIEEQGNVYVERLIIE